MAQTGVLFKGFKRLEHLDYNISFIKSILGRNKLFVHLDCSNNRTIYDRFVREFKNIEIIQQETLLTCTPSHHFALDWVFSFDIDVLFVMEDDHEFECNPFKKYKKEPIKSFSEYFSNYIITKELYLSIKSLDLSKIEVKTKNDKYTRDTYLHKVPLFWDNDLSIKLKYLGVKEEREIISKEVSKETSRKKEIPCTIMRYVNGKLESIKIL